MEKLLLSLLIFCVSPASVTNAAVIYVTTFRMNHGVAHFGEFAGTETLHSQRTEFGMAGINENMLNSHSIDAFCFGNTC